MSFAEIFEKQRQVIPRWHTYAVARWLRMTLAESKRSEKNLADEGYAEIVHSWENNGNIVHAADLVGNALVFNRFDDEAAVKAAKFILNNKEKATKSLIEISEDFIRLSRNEPPPLPNVVAPERDDKFYSVIANLKARVREYPRNPILWMDIAFYYSSMGQESAANHAAAIALSLNKENRYLLRSGSRFLMHSGSPDKALNYLRRSDLGQYDPWLVAAEIAISDALEIPSKRIKIARRMIESDSFPKLHLSELASALGTIEIKNGARRKGRKMFGISLEDPTENALAQATFMQNEIGEELRTKISTERLAQSFEAQARLQLSDKEFSGAIEATKKWFAYQPFSSKPAVMGSYIASVALGRFDDAIKMAEMGRLSSPKDVMLKNNLAFSLASLGKIGEAEKALASIDLELTDSEKSTLAATKGLIEFRKGNMEEGRNCYRLAVDSFGKQKDFRSAAIAKFFWAREEEIVGSATAKALREDALKVAKRLNINELLPTSSQTEDKSDRPKPLKKKTT